MDEVWSGPTHEFTFPVEAGHVLAFTRALGIEHDGTVPPTFAVVADHFDPQFVRRPPLGRGWRDGLPASHLHVEQSFTYTRPLRIGETLIARRGQGRVWTRQGRTAGHLRFVEERTELFDDEGASVVVVSWVDVHAEQSHVDLTTRQATTAPAPAPAPPPGSSGVVVAEEITRTQIVMYVGASGDFHPLHHDDHIAQRNGYPSVFVPGMLTMGLTGKVITAAIDGEQLRGFSGRFRAQVWPGSTLTTTVASTRGDDRREISLTTRDQHGAVVFEGVAIEGETSE